MAKFLSGRRGDHSHKIVEVLQGFPTRRPLIGQSVAPIFH